MLSRLRHWIPAICVATLIFLFSTRYFSSEQTGHVIIPFFRWIFPAATPRMLYLMHLGIRKLAHVTEFGVFSITVFHGVRGGRTGWRPDWALLTLLIAVAYAALDEWHQTFVPVRQARLRDVAIDAVGALLAQSFVWAYSKWNSGPSLLQGRHAREELSAGLAATCKKHIVESLFRDFRE